MKKVLFFTYDFPFPITSGGKNRAYHMLKYGGENVELHLFSFIRKDFKNEYLDELKKIGVKKITLLERKNSEKKNLAREILRAPHQSIFKSLYYDRAIEQKLQDYIVQEKIDVLHAESFYTGFYLSAFLKKMGVKQIYGSENVEYLIYKEYVKNSVPFLMKPAYFYQVKKIESEEKKISHIANTVITVSEDDKSIFESISNSSVRVVDNGIDTKSLKPIPLKDTKALLFVGNFSYFPNIEAIENFYSNVFTHLNGVRLFVVGKNAKEKLSFVKDGNVQIYNFVPDLRDVYEKSDIFVFPIQFGGGTNFKLLEAMAYGLPIVGFGDKIKNIHGIGSNDYIAVETYKEMKDSIINLLDDKVRRSELSKRGRKIIEEYYSWERIGKNLSDIWQKM